MSKLLEPSELAEGGPAIDATTAPGALDHHPVHAAGRGLVPEQMSPRRRFAATRRTGALAAVAVLLLALLAAVAVGRARSTGTALVPAAPAAVPAPSGWTGTCRAGGGDCLPDEDYPAGAAAAVAIPARSQPAFQVSPPNERDPGASVQNADAAAPAPAQRSPGWLDARDYATTNERGAGRAHQRFLELNELPAASEEVTPRQGPR